MAKLRDLEEEDDDMESFYEHDAMVERVSMKCEETKEDYNIDRLMSSDCEEIIRFKIDDETENKSYFSESMKTSLNEDFKALGVEIVDIILHDITFSDEIQSDMAEKTIQISNEKEKQAQNRYDLLTLMQKEEITTLKQTIEEEKVGLLKGGDYDKLIESLELRYENSQLQDTVEKIKAQTEIDVNLISAESEYTIQKIIFATKLETRKILEESKAESTVATVDAIGEARKVEANADMECATFEAIGQKGKF